MADLGTDFSCTTGLDPTFRIVSGPRVVAEAIFRRITTRRGSLFYAPTYGTDVREMLGARLDQRRLDAWRGKIESECRKDERVDSVRVSLSFDPRLERVEIKIDGTTGAGPFRLVLAVTSVTVELLTVG